MVQPRSFSKGSVLGREEEYIDNENNNESVPFYFSEDEQIEFSSYDDCTYGFADRPARASNVTGVYWIGELTLVQKTEEGYKPLLTVTYGFNNDPEEFKLYDIKISEQSEFQKRILEKINNGSE